MQSLLNYTQEPAFKRFLAAVFLAGAFLFLLGLFIRIFWVKKSSGPKECTHFLGRFLSTSLNILTILAIFVISILYNMQGEKDMAGQFFSSLIPDFFGPLTDSVDFKNNIDLHPMLLFYYFLLTFLLNLIVNVIKETLGYIKSKKFTYWWFTESATIVFGTFLFVLAKNLFEDRFPVDQMDGLAYIIIFGVIILISLVIVLWDPHGLIGDYLYIIPISLITTTITMVIACLFSIMGGFGWLNGIKGFFDGPLSIPNVLAYIVLLILFIFLWYFVWAILHAF